MRKVTAGNWKMNLTIQEGMKLVTEIVEGLQSESAKNNPGEMIVAPGYLALDQIQNLVETKKWSSIKVAAQDVHYENSGAFTGKVSIAMLQDIGIEYCIVGHSEQRTLFHETNETVNLKILKLLEAKMNPILCIGETLEERNAGKLNEVLTEQLKLGLKDVKSQDLNFLIIAYEPVWAIGTGVTASNKDAEAAHLLIRSILKDIYQIEITLPILYGGSVKPDNAKGLFACPNIDGGLVGGASLKSADFLAIHQAWL